MTLAHIFRRRPLASTIDLASPRVSRDPQPWYEKLRRDGAVQYLPRHDAWIVLGHDEVQSVFLDPATFSNAPYGDVDGVLLGADPPDHTEVRRCLAPLFSAPAVEKLAAFAEERAESLCRPRMDVVAEYANELTSAVAARLIGLTDEDEKHIRQVRGPGAPPSDYDALLHALGDAAERAAVFGQLVSDGFEVEQARSLTRLLWLAATTTTERAIVHCMLRLLQHPEARDVSLLTPFVEEVLRLHPPELLVPRCATRSAQIGSVTVPQDAVIYLSLAAANRDPAKFACPAEFRLDRPPVRIFTFGLGVHHCVGVTLGRAVIRIAIRTLLARGARFRATHSLRNLVGWSSRTASPVGRLVIEVGS